MSENIKSLDKIPLEFYKREAGHFSAEHFASRHPGVGFLVSHGPLPQDDDPHKTQSITAFKTYTGKGLESIAQDTHPPGSVVFELPLEQLKRKAQLNLLPVGRGKNLPITVEHGKVSKFHGYFTYENGALMYVDDSSNGTKINDQPVVKGEKNPVESHCSVTLAESFTFTYYSAGDFHDVLCLLL